MPSTLQCERARLQFHQVNFEGMAAELDDRYNKRKMPYATNGLGWLSDVEKLNNIRLALQSFWMEALLRDERDKLYRFGEWLEYHSPTSWASIRPFFLLPLLQQVYEAGAVDSRDWATTEPAWWNLLIQNAKLHKPNREWRLAHKVEDRIAERFGEFVKAQPEHQQILQKASLEAGGCERLAKDTLLYQLLCVYREPKPEEVLAVAMASSPFYDVDRLEKMHPGFKGLVTALGSLDLPVAERNTLCREFLEKAAKGEDFLVRVPLPGNATF